MLKCKLYVVYLYTAFCKMVLEAKNFSKFLVRGELIICPNNLDGRKERVKLFRMEEHILQEMETERK